MIISLAPFATALQKSSAFATGRVSRTQNIISKKIMTNNSRTAAQQATRLEMGAGQKFVPNIRTAMNFTKVASPAYTQLKSRVTGAETWTSPFSRSFTGLLTDVKAYVADTDNATVVAAFQTTADDLGLTDFTVRDNTEVYSGVEIAISAYLALADNKVPGLTHILSTLVAGDAAALKTAVGFTAK